MSTPKETVQTAIVDVDLGATTRRATYAETAVAALASLRQHRDDIARVLAGADAGPNRELLRAAWANHPDTHPVKAHWLAQADAVLDYLTGGAA